MVEGRIQATQLAPKALGALQGTVCLSSHERPEIRMAQQEVIWPGAVQRPMGSLPISSSSSILSRRGRREGKVP